MNEQKRLLALAAGGSVPAIVYLHIILTGLSTNVERLNDRIQTLEINVAALQVSLKQALDYPGKKYPGKQ